MAIARVNFYAAFANNGGGATTIAAAATSLTTGNTILVAVRSGNTSVITGVADTAGNRYVQLATTTVASSRWDLWGSWNVVGHGSNVVTATYNTGSTFNAIMTVQYSGVAPTPFDGAFPGPSTLTIAGVTTMVSDAVLVYFAQVDATGSTWTPDTGWTAVGSDGSTVTYCMEKVVSSLQASASVAATCSSGAGKASTMVALAQASGGSSSGSGGSYAFVG